MKTQAAAAATMGNCVIRQNQIMQTGEEVAESMKGNRVFGGQVYYPVEELNKNSESEAETEGGNGSLVRIKLVITKQELQVMLTKGGFSVGDLVSHVKKDDSDDQALVIEEEDDDGRNCGRWKPVLDSIPESELS